MEIAHGVASGAEGSPLVIVGDCEMKSIIAEFVENQPPAVRRSQDNAKL
jgi:hypothetical protein